MNITKWLRKQNRQEPEVWTPATWQQPPICTGFLATGQGGMPKALDVCCNCKKPYKNHNRYIQNPWSPKWH